MTVSIAYLCDHFRYDAETGNLYRIKRARSERLGLITKRNSGPRGGHIATSINKRNYFAHRIAWALYYGYWPKFQIDHINGIRDDNRIANLRLCDNSQNQMNQKLPRDNKSGFKGVYSERGRNGFIAQIFVGGRRKYLGKFADRLDAAKAYDAAAITYCGAFARLNFPPAPQTRPEQ